MSQHGYDCPHGCTGNNPCEHQARGVYTPKAVHWDERRGRPWRSPVARQARPPAVDDDVVLLIADDEPETDLGVGWINQTLNLRGQAARRGAAAAETLSVFRALHRYPASTHGLRVLLTPWGNLEV